VWLHVVGLGIACTGSAYILFFRLGAHVGPTRAVWVTFLIPVFGVLWGILFLGEQLTLNMLIGCAVILLGTSLSTGVLAPGKKASLSANGSKNEKDSLLRPGR
jgi:drug/metabolite transporter (DMT)-like permease